MPIISQSFHPISVTNGIKNKTVKVNHPGKRITATVQITSFRRNRVTRQIDHVQAGIIRIKKSGKFKKYRFPRQVTWDNDVSQIDWSIQAGNCGAHALLVIYYYD